MDPRPKNNSVSWREKDFWLLGLIRYAFSCLILDFYIILHCIRKIAENEIGLVPLLAIFTELLPVDKGKIILPNTGSD